MVGAPTQLAVAPLGGAGVPIAASTGPLRRPLETWHPQRHNILTATPSHVSAILLGAELDGEVLLAVMNSGGTV